MRVAVLIEYLFGVFMGNIFYGTGLSPPSFSRADSAIRRRRGKEREREREREREIVCKPLFSEPKADVTVL